MEDGKELERVPGWKAMTEGKQMERREECDTKGKRALGGRCTFGVRVCTHVHTRTHWITSRHISAEPEVILTPAR